MAALEAGLGEPPFEMSRANPVETLKYQDY